MSTGISGLKSQADKMYPTEYVFDKADRILRAGGIVIAPTETFYALVADPFKENAVRQIFSIKDRDERKPLPLIAADLATVKNLIPSEQELAHRMMERFWPGSLTILLETSQDFSQLLTGPGGKIGVRVPPWCPARILATRTSGLITATSANISGGPDPVDVSDISPLVSGSVDLVLDLGPAPGGRPSTVVELTNRGFRIVREGAIPESAIQEFVEQNR
jgi:L-threonylcarbamoyladenylate synthase